jgi:hypothetical protein
LFTKVKIEAKIEVEVVVALKLNLPGCVGNMPGTPSTMRGISVSSMGGGGYAKMKE